MKQKKKTPSDYPQFYCRMNEADKAEIDSLVEKIVMIKTKSIGPEDLLPKRNEYIVKGLKRGLKSILRELS